MFFLVVLFFCFFLFPCMGVLEHSAKWACLQIGGNTFKTTFFLGSSVIHHDIWVFPVPFRTLKKLPYPIPLCCLVENGIPTSLTVIIYNKPSSIIPGTKESMFFFGWPKNWLTVYRGFLKWWYPQIVIFQPVSRDFPYKTIQLLGIP